MPEPRYFETHCHLNHAQFADDLDAVTARARAAGVTDMLIIGYDLPSSEWAVRLCSPEEGRYASVGVHPHDAAEWNADAERAIRRMAAQPGVVAIGEIGLDFYRDLSPRNAQYEAFRAQLDLAAELDLPIVVHTRESVTPSLDVLEPYALEGLRVVMHCWSGTLEEARRAIGLGMFLGIGGVVTYKNAGDLPRVATDAPLDRLLLETDSPYLPPVPHRGKRNDPAFVPLIAERIAELRNAPVDEIAAATYANARGVFGLGM